MRKADRLNRLPPYPFSRWAAEVARVRAQLQERDVDVIRLDIGNPDLAPPEAVIDALSASAHEPAHHGYSGYRGLPSLRRAMADYYGRRFNVVLDSDTQVVPLIGSKEGIVNMALSWLDPGDLALVPDPGYAPYTMGAMLAGAEVTTFPLLASRDFLPDLTAIPAVVADRARMMWLNYPNNPTGAVADLDFLTEAVAFARRHDILLCFDAPYCDVTYGEYVAPSILEVPGAMDVAVEFNSLSKTYNMAGWRMGMAVGNPDVLAALAQVKSNVDSGMFHPMQSAAIEALALPSSWMEQRNVIYRERLAIIVEGLRAVGLDARMPQAALYVWAGLDEGVQAETVARRWLEEVGVAVAPGTFFGPAGDGYLRVSATAPTEQIRAAMTRLRTLA